MVPVGAAADDRGPDAHCAAGPAGHDASAGPDSLSPGAAEAPSQAALAGSWGWGNQLHLGTLPACHCAPAPAVQLLSICPYNQHADSAPARLPLPQDAMARCRNVALHFLRRSEEPLPELHDATREATSPCSLLNIVAPLHEHHLLTPPNPSAGPLCTPACSAPEEQPARRRNEVPCAPAAAHVAERLDRVLGLPYVTVTPQVMPLQQPDQAPSDALQHAHAHADGLGNGLYPDQACGSLLSCGLCNAVPCLRARMG